MSLYVFLSLRVLWLGSLFKPWFGCPSFHFRCLWLCLEVQEIMPLLCTLRQWKLTHWRRLSLRFLTLLRLQRRLIHIFSSQRTWLCLQRRELRPLTKSVLRLNFQMLRSTSWVCSSNWYLLHKIGNCSLLNFNLIFLLILPECENILKWYVNSNFFFFQV